MKECLQRKAEIAKRNPAAGRLNSRTCNGSLSSRVAVLQRCIGNQAVQRLSTSGILQAKLQIGQSHDIYEQEADRLAEQVMRMPVAVIRMKSG
jgi:hypothetical protein